MIQIKRNELKQLAQDKLGNDSIESQNKVLVMISTSLAARTSYTVVGDEKEIDYEKMIELHDRLIEMRHDSPLEHCARAMSDEEYNSFLKGSFWDEYVYRPYEVPEINLENSDKSKLGWCYNIKGFIPYRYIIDKYYR